MVSIHDVKPIDLIMAVAEDLKKRKEFELPSWAPFVKTGLSRQRPPENPDWWWIRAAALLRTISAQGPVGISKLRSKYGGSQNRGRKRSIFVKSSGSIIRTIVQQLEEAGLVKKKFVKEADKKDKKSKISIYKGREIAPTGQALLDKYAKQVYKAPKAEAKPEKPKAEVKVETPKVEVIKEEKKEEAKPKEKKAKKPAKEGKDERAGDAKSAKK